MKVSVIIPVYNAIPFLEKAVGSALEQPETAEVVLVDDGSTDDTLELCVKLAAKDERIKIYQHDDKGNHGTAATRNVGIRRSTCEFIALLDNDDFFLPGRFSRAKEIMLNDPAVDGVYEAIGTYSYNEESLRVHLERMRQAKSADLMLTTLREPVPPEQLLETLVIGDKGWLHFNGLTLRKSVFEKVGLFDEALWYDEDNDLFFRLAHSARLVAGRLNEPVAMRGVHPLSRTLMPEEQKRMQHYHIPMWKKLFNLVMTNQFKSHLNRYIVNQRLNYYNHKIVDMSIGMPRKAYKAAILAKLLIKHPSLIGKLL